MADGVNFILQKEENVEGKFSNAMYAGASVHNIGSAFGSSFGNGLGGGLFTSKQTKREGSVFDAKKANVYLTNKRIVVYQASTFGNKDKGMISEIVYGNIKAINETTKLFNPAVDLSIGNGNEINNVKIWFQSKDKKKDCEEFLNLVKKFV